MYTSISGDMAKCYEHLAASHYKRSQFKEIATSFKSKPSKNWELVTNETQETHNRQWK